MWISQRERRFLPRNGQKEEFALNEECEYEKNLHRIKGDVTHISGVQRYHVVNEILFSMLGLKTRNLKTDIKLLVIVSLTAQVFLSRFVK